MKQKALVTYGKKFQVNPGRFNNIFKQFKRAFAEKIIFFKISSLLRTRIDGGEFEVLEKLIRSRLQIAVEEPGDLAEKQHDFRKRRSTIGAVRKVLYGENLLTKHEQKVEENGDIKTFGESSK